MCMFGFNRSQTKGLKAFRSAKYKGGSNDTQGEVSEDDVREFLQYSARRHRVFSQYTKGYALKEILRTNRLRLSIGCKMNDVLECQKTAQWNRTYVASFSHAETESIAMYWMYGYVGPNSLPDDAAEADNFPVRLVFPAKIVYEYVDTLDVESIATHPTGTETIRNLHNVRPCSISFHDVMYQRAFRSRREVEQIKNETERLYLGGYRDAATINMLTAFVKDDGWAYEKESRLVITLACECPQIEYLYVPFDKVLQSMEIIVGPCKHADKRVEEIKQLVARQGPLFKSSVSVRKSEYVVHFPD